MIIHEEKFEKFYENCPLLYVNEYGDALCKGNPIIEERMIYNFEDCYFEKCPIAYWINVISE